MSETKVFEVTVPGTRVVNVTAHYAFEGDLSDSVGTFADGEPTAGQLNQQ